ncbi:MAG: class I tRNA ligase family protein, partial [Armatimonadetes bacterium]|nr:class I tRNA ligase family protein [Armatimonadota bacterium]
FHFNTAIAALMEVTNFLSRAKETAVEHQQAWMEALRALVLLMAPITPHVAEEMWARLGGADSVHRQAWPSYDPALLREETITLVVQVDGRVRDRITVAADIADETARDLALRSDGARRSLAGRAVKEVIVVPGRLVNVVTDKNS